MIGLAHIALHLALCGPVARLSPQATFAVHVRVSDKIGRPQVDRMISLQRGYGDEAVAEFDVARGLYRLQIAVPKYGCSASDFVIFMSDHNRTITERLATGAYTERLPLMLSGTTPPAFFYAHPEFVAFDRSAACNQPLVDPLPLQAQVENDQDAYYAQLFPQLSASARPLLVAVRLRTAAAQYHYIRIPVTLPPPSGSWPTAYQLDIPEEYLDTLATEPVDTLLCPKFLKTSVE